jgi:hypothetical protein
VTVIVAWKCTDGIVVGADSAATLGSHGQQTVKESIASKLAIVRDSLILAVSGPISLAQKYEEELESYPTPDFNALRNKAPGKACEEITGLFWKHAEAAYQRSAVVAHATGNRAALVDALHGSVVALRIKGQDRLFQFTDTCAGEEATEQLPYLSIGSGQQNADPFLAFIRRTFWRDAIPSLAGGIFATLWTLDETILSAPGGIGGPPTMAILRDGNARFLEEDDLREHTEAVESARTALRSWRQQLEP